MGITANSQTLHDGERNLVVQFTGIHDGIGGQETSVVKVDADQLSGKPIRYLDVMKVYGTVNGGIVVLEWGGDVAQELLTLATGENEFDYCKVGGIHAADLSIANGDIILSTNGFVEGSAYSIKLEMVKRF